MSEGEKRENRDLVVPPNSYVYIQSDTNGRIVTHVGPCMVTVSGQDKPVIYNSGLQQFRECRLDQAINQCPRAPEGDYVVLTNPVQGGNRMPPSGVSKEMPDLQIGRKVNIAGPEIFPLWPGQSAEVIKGHHLKSNQYLVGRVYNAQEATNNWGKGEIVARATETETTTESEGKEVKEETPPTELSKEIQSFTMGQLIIIKGTDYSFYIPPTGVEVIPEGTSFVREAVTLERLEHCVLVDEDGNKRYEKGPAVVFPQPTETFVTDDANHRKFRAYELNEIQGIHLKAIAAYKDGDKQVNIGDEIFITGKDTPIYFPREEHSIVKYGKRDVKHYAIAIPEGEARYLMNRLTGEITKVTGPTMLLPNPIKEVVVRRILTDKQSNLWYPGNVESLTHNRQLRSEPSDVEIQNISASSRVRAKGLSRSISSYSDDDVGAQYAFAANAPTEDAGRAHMPDSFTRGSKFTEPRTVTLDTKYDGVPEINVWNGYAVMKVDKSGNRKVVQGPESILLAYDEDLETLTLSRGLEKTDRDTKQTVYLRTLNNKVEILVNAETNDHVSVSIRLSLRVNFDQEFQEKWFNVENYVKFLSDHVGSILKGEAKNYTIEEFYGRAISIVRDRILGKSVKAEGKKPQRPDMLFKENGMRVVDVEILDVEIGDDKIADMLLQAQHYVISKNITLNQTIKSVDIAKKQEELEREAADAKALTRMHSLEIQEKELGKRTGLDLATNESKLQILTEQKKSEDANQTLLDTRHDADLARDKRATDQQEVTEQAKLKRELEELVAETEAMVARFKAGEGDFSQALLTLGNNETLERVAKAASIQTMIGGESFTDVIQKILAGSGLKNVFQSKLVKDLLEAAEVESE